MSNVTSEYTPREDIRDVLQVLVLILARPAVKTNGERCTLAAYAELQRMKKRLEHAVSILEEDMKPKLDAITAPLSINESRVVTRLYVRGLMTASQLASEINTAPDAMERLLISLAERGIVKQSDTGRNWLLAADHSSGIGADDDRNRSL